MWGRILCWLDLHDWQKEWQRHDRFFKVVCSRKSCRKHYEF